MYQAKDAATARLVYTRGTLDLPDSEIGADYFLRFAQFEEKCGETARARVIIKYALYSS